MKKTCRNCGIEFRITEEDREFLDRLFPVIAGKPHPIPPPTHCPECRQQRRIAFRNDWNYYRNSCCLCKKQIVSIYSPDKTIPVLCEECFWSDQFDPVAHGRAIDWGRTFFEQFADMRSTTPRLAIFHTQSENAEYTVHSSRNRNSYMSSSIVDCEEIHFSDFAFESRDCLDLCFCEKMELCYECIDCDGCFDCEYCELCTTTSSSQYCFDCKGCQHCLGCVSLRSGDYRILNEEASKEEYGETEQRLKIDPAFRRQFVGKFEELRSRAPRPEAWLIGCEGSSGNYLSFSRNARHCFNVKYCEDVRFAFEGHRSVDCCDIMRVGIGEMLYECKGIVDTKYSAFCNLTYQSDHCLYCDNSQQLRDSFGCMSMKKNQYCILNRKYSKEEYEAIVPRLIAKMQEEGAWGEFFPVTLSPFGYNETKAMEWYPMTKEEVVAKGWKWSDYEQPLAEGLQTIAANRLPTNIGDVTDDILNVAIECEVTKKPFRIIKQELDFYKKKNLPIPRRSPRQRHQDRTAHHKDRTLHDRTCAKCGRGIQTTYPPSRPEIVYCEKCYLAIVY